MCVLDNSSNITMSFVNRGTKMMVLFGGTPLILSGLVTSILSLAMFHFDTFTPATTKLMLKTTTVADFLLLTTAIFYLQFKAIFVVFPENTQFLKELYENPKFYGIVFYVINFCEMFRNWLVVLIGIERYLVIRHPLHFKEWWSIKRTYLGILICALLTTVMRIPALVRVTTRNTNDTSIKFISDVSYTTHSVIDSIFLTVLPVLILTCCSIQIRSAMARSMRLREASKSTDRINYTVNKVLTVVLTVFTVCGMPFLFSSFITLSVYRFNDSCWLTAAHTIVSSVCWIFSLFFSASNFYVYILHWSKYREIMQRMLTCRKIPTSLPSSGHQSSMEHHNEATHFIQHSSSINSNRNHPKNHHHHHHHHQQSNHTII